MKKEIDNEKPLEIEFNNWTAILFAAIALVLLFIDTSIGRNTQQLEAINKTLMEALKKPQIEK